MKYKSYPKYKNSGVEWLGEIPERWNAKRIGYHFTDRREKVSDKDYPALSVSMQGIVPQMEHVAKTEDNDNRKLVRTGDLAINSRSDRKGASGLSQYDGSVSLINTVLIPDQDIYGWFAHHLIRSQAFQEEFYRYGKGIVADLWSTNFNEMKDIYIPVPSLPTQRAIATFLDTETARIDGLIKDYEDLIELLKEKRQALISHAVTRGLSELVSPDDPEYGEWAKPVKFKNSGVEWIGEIPEGWVVSKIGYQATFSSGATPSKDNDSYWNGEIPWVSPKDMKVKEIWDSEDHVSDEAVTNSTLKLVPIDTLLIVVRGMILIRDFPVAITKKPVTINQDMKALQVNKRMNPRYLYAFLIGIKNQILTFFIDEAAHGTLAIRMDVFKGLPVIVPSTSAQQAIANFLDRETAKMDLLVSESESAIELLKEHRSALITNAVTGKINVENIA